MNRKLKFQLLLILALLVSCSTEKKESLYTTYDEIIQDLNSSANFKKKYKNRDVFITGVIKYIGEPKDMSPNTNTSYIELAGEDESSVIIYFDYLISKDVVVSQTVKVKCFFHKLYKADYMCNDALVEFNKGVLISISD